MINCYKSAVKKDTKFILYQLTTVDKPCFYILLTVRLCVNHMLKVTWYLLNVERERCCLVCMLHWKAVSNLQNTSFNWISLVSIEQWVKFNTTDISLSHGTHVYKDNPLVWLDDHMTVHHAKLIHAWCHENLGYCHLLVKTF